MNIEVFYCCCGFDPYQGYWAEQWLSHLQMGYGRLINNEDGGDALLSICEGL